MWKKRQLSRKEKITRAIYIELAILGALIITIWSHSFDLMVAGATPPINQIEVYSPVKEKELTIEEHICAATNGENCEILVNLAKCESSLNKSAYNVNSNGTVDLGLFQWNSVHFYDRITPECALDVYCSARETNKEIKNGNGHIWVCWDNI